MSAIQWRLRKRVSVFQLELPASGPLLVVLREMGCFGFGLDFARAAGREYCLELHSTSKHIKWACWNKTRAFALQIYPSFAKIIGRIKKIQDYNRLASGNE
jgi:hypothetical protein